MPVPPHRVPGDTGHVDDHNDMSDVLTSHDTTISTTSAALTTHTAGSDPHGDRAYADSTKATIGHTHSYPVTSVNGHTAAVTLGPADVGAVAVASEGVANGVATLDSSTLVPVAQIPNLAATKITSGTFAIAQIPTGTSGTTVSLGNHTHTFPVTSVNTKTGVVVLVPSDIGAVALGVSGATSGPEYTPADHGMQAWAYDPVRVGSTSTVVTAGVLNVIRMKLPISGSLTKVLLYVNTAGATIANCFAGLYDSSGNRVALTADQSGAWVSTGLKTISFTGSYSATAGYFWVDILVGSATTAPAFGRNTSSVATGLINANLTAASLRFATILTGQTTLPASFTPASLAASDSGYWAGLA
jgi:hypothetical protein